MKRTIFILTTAMVIAGLFYVGGCVEKGIPPNIQKSFDKYVDYWNTGNFEGIEEVIDSSFEMIESPSFEPKKGIENLKQIILDTRTAYPDFKLEILDVVYNNDKLGIIWTCKGTNTGPGNLLPTGKVINGKGVSFLHFKNGKIKDEWLANNNLLWMKQLGWTFVPPVSDTVKQVK